MSTRTTRLGRRLWCLGALAGFLALDLSVASCATTDDARGTGDEGDGASPIPSVDAAPDAGVDACASDAEGCSDRDPPPCESVEWCLEKTSHPAGIGLASVWGSGPNDVWTVGASGTVTHWDGKTWTTFEVDTGWSLRAVWGSGPNDVWTMGAPDQIFHSKGFNGGQAQWTRVAAVTEETLSPPALFGAIWGTSASDVWIAGARLFMQRGNDVFSELAWRTTEGDGGVVWAPGLQDQNWTFDTAYGIWGTSADDVWVVGTKSDGLPFAAHSQSPANEGEATRWTELDTQALAGFYAVWGSGANDVWAVGDYGTIRHATADATVLTIIESPTKENLRGIWGSGPKDIWAVGERGTLIHYDGDGWRVATAGFVPGTKPNLYGVWGSGPNDVWAVGSGIVLHYSGPKPGARGANP